MSSNNFLSTLLYAGLGGFFMGTYPVFIKTPAVLKAKIPPLVFQLYKTTMVFLLGFLFLIPRSFQHRQPDEPLFVFSWWGFASACLWVPAGLSTIASVPMVGMGFQVATTCSWSSLLSFLVFTIFVQKNSKMKAHSCGDNCVFYLAPLYLCCMTLGMLAMVFVSNIAQHPLFLKYVGRKLKTCDDDCNGYAKNDAADTDAMDKESQGLILTKPTIQEQPTSINGTATGTGTAGSGAHKILGTCLSIAAGTFASCQYGIVELGKEIEMSKYNCSASSVSSNQTGSRYAEAPSSTAPPTCPWQMREQFDQGGSWFVSFGMGAFCITVILLVVSSLWNGRVPSLFWSELKSAGVLAGLFWVIGNAFITLAVTTGGNAVGVPQSLAAMLMTSGGWGILWYKEGGSNTERYVWVGAALLTLVFMVLLGSEKVQKV